MLKYCTAMVLPLVMFSQACFSQQHEIAITIDDLPFVGHCNNDTAKLKRQEDRFMKILQALVDNHVPATGFVIAGAIERGQWELLERFKNAGLNLGNHTYSHKSLDSMSAAKYIADLDKADQILTPLFPERKYFRYPYLAEGRGEKRKEVYKYLEKHHYHIAPVTIDTKDFLFNKQLYGIPYRLRPQNLDRLKQRYLAYIEKQTRIAERQAAAGEHNSKQILLIHSNLLNSHFMGDIIDFYRKRNYRFITLEEALSHKPVSEPSYPSENRNEGTQVDPDFPDQEDNHDSRSIDPEENRSLLIKGASRDKSFE